MFKLKPAVTRYTYQMGDQSGYRFEIETLMERGIAQGSHSATVTMSTYGFATPERAVGHLEHAAEAFLRQLRENVGLEVESKEGQA